jgi:glycosyltransferase involved in cell wall biosynthesis
MIKVALVSTYPPQRCGIACYTCSLAQALVKDINTEVVIIAEKRPWIKRNYEGEKISLLRVWRRDSWTYGVRILYEALREKVKVLHLQYSFGLYGHTLAEFIPLFIALRIAQKKTVVTLHSTCPMSAYKDYLQESVGMSRFRAWLSLLQVVLITKLICKLSHVIIVHSDNAKQRLVDQYSVDESKIYVIPHGSENYASMLTMTEAKEQLSLKGKKVILFFGFLTPRKGIDYLVKALPEILARHKDAVLLVVGSYHRYTIKLGQEYMANVKRIAETLDVVNRFIIIEKFVPDWTVPLYFTAADVVALPYVHLFGASGVLKIAASYGKPVVTTTLGSNVDELIDGENALLVPPKDSKALAQAINLILKDDWLKSTLGKNIRKLGHVVNWQKIALMTRNIYVNILPD